ncbi:MAG TPA: HNH endonuclease signature motif containing protein, partial [Propionibacteriaceae bacterium]|nr:HNH endonuclease signature motif containing protein [Propionibacteriaceae bacterium]
HAQGPIRYALEQRDRGCVFPGCDKPPTACHAHHITPWWAGGSTSLTNMALLCPHHHRIVEPTHNPDHDRWRIRINTDHLPEISPPKRVDPRQRPRLHARFRRHALTGDAEKCATSASDTRHWPDPDDGPPPLVTSPAWTS